MKSCAIWVSPKWHTVHSTFCEKLSIVQKLKWRDTDTKSVVISEAYLFPVEKSTLKFMVVNEGCTLVLLLTW
jgi:hypothetical protein